MYVSMKGMLKRANEGNYAVMAINCFNIETARAVINAAQSLRAPIIINIVQEHMVNHCDSNLIAPIVKKLAQRASVEVALNFDHGEEIGLLKKALVDGYSSVMVDASRYNLEGNIRMTREIVEFAQQFDASVEGEIGCMGASEGDNYTDDDMKTNPDEALRFAKETGIDEVYSRLLPDEKLAKLQEQRSKHGAVMFVGDGINDAPVLAGADCGAAMGSGADAAIEAADVVFMTSNVEAIPQAISIGKKACKIAWQNVVFALAIKALVMILGLLGFANMWIAVFADTGVSVLCLLNSIRILLRK